MECLHSTVWQETIHEVRRKCNKARSGVNASYLSLGPAEAVHAREEDHAWPLPTIHRPGNVGVNVLVGCLVAGVERNDESVRGLSGLWHLLSRLVVLNPNRPVTILAQVGERE